MDECYVVYKPNHTSIYIVYINWNKIYSLFLLCDAYNEVHDIRNDLVN